MLAYAKQRPHGAWIQWGQVNAGAVTGFIYPRAGSELSSVVGNSKAMGVACLHEAVDRWDWRGRPSMAGQQPELATWGKGEGSGLRVQCQVALRLYLRDNIRLDT